MIEPAWKVAGAVFFFIAAFFVYRAVTIPDHVHRVGIFTTAPDAGYKWQSPGSLLDRSAQWNPGATNPDHPHITAGADEGKWTPDPGYGFDNENTLIVSWRPGATRADHPHITASAQEGQWAADPGYVLNAPDSLDVTWKPGSTHPSYPHITASETEGVWTPDEGYTFSNPGTAGDLTVVWTPGKPHSQLPHIMAADEVDKWVPFPGYAWVDFGKSMAVVWTPGMYNSRADHVRAANTPDQWYADPGYHLAQLNGHMIAAPDDDTASAGGSSSYSGTYNSSSNTGTSHGPNVLGAIVREGISRSAGDCAADEDHWLLTRLICGAVSIDQHQRAEDDLNGH